MKNQRGSVLVGVIGISIAMSVAAGGFILLSSNTAGIEVGSATNLQLHYAAESGIFMGVRWVKAHNNAGTAWPNYQVITPGGESFTTIDGIKVKVTFEVGAPGGGAYQLKSVATPGSGMEMVEVSWQINSFNPDAAGKAVPSLQNWKETYTPAP
jgi:hypothetical protein